MDKKKVRDLIIEVLGINMNNVTFDDNEENNERIGKEDKLLIEALKEFENPDKVYVVIERPLDAVTLSSEIGKIHVTSSAEKAIEYYIKGEDSTIVIKKVEE